MEVKLITAFIIMEIIVLLLLGSGFFLGYKFGEDDLISVGCWKEVTKTNRSISIMVNNRDIEEIIDTARHEICHEIDFRLMDYNATEWNNKGHEEKEEFANTCNPEEYLNISN